MRQFITAPALALAFWAATGGGAVQAQQNSTAAAPQPDSANVAFGGFRGDPSLPVTVTSQELTVDEGKSTAVFTGDVLVVQGEMRLSANELRVEYDEEQAKISRMWAYDNVLLVNARDAAQSQRAEYDVIGGIVTMTDQVVLTQGAATFTADRFVADLTTGLGRLEGGVTSTFTPNAAKDDQADGNASQ